jgi:hypothetical protein
MNTVHKDSTTSNTIGIVGRFQASLAVSELMRRVQFVDESAIQIVVEMDREVVTLHDIFAPDQSVQLHGMEAGNFLRISWKLAKKSGLNYRDAQKATAFDYRKLMGGAKHVRT